MKLLAMLTWVAQFGFSMIFPMLFFLLLAVWLQNRYDLGMWIIVILGILGLFTSISTTRANLKALLKAADEATDRNESPPTAFNNHE